MCMFRVSLNFILGFPKVLSANAEVILKERNPGFLPEGS